MIPYNSADKSKETSSGLWRLVMLWWDTKIFKVSPWRWRQHGATKRWYTTTTLYGITTQKTST